jgi:PAS domain S-box-containing protein
MASAKKKMLYANHRPAIQFLAAIVAFLGMSVIVGWVIESSALIQVSASFVPMQFNTALGFFLSGIGLLASTRGYKNIAVILGVIVTAIGLLTIIQYVLNIDLGIDQLLMDHYITTQTANPGRMAPNTAFCFSLCGIILSLVNRFPHLNLLTVLGMLITGLGAIASFGYATDINMAYGWGHLTRMAVHTSIGFMLIGVAFVLWGLNLTREASKSSYPILLSTLGMTLLALVIALWQALNGWEDDRLKLEVQHQLNRFDDAFIAKLQSQSAALNRMAFRWQNHESLSQSLWQMDATNYYNDFSFFNSISKVDNLLNTHWTIPADKKDQAIDKKYILEKEYDDFLLKAKSQKLVVASKPIQLSNGYFGIIVFAPLIKNKEIEGFLEIVIDLSKMLDVIPKPLNFNENYKVTLHNNDYIFAETSTNKIINDQFKVTSSIDFEGLEWKTELAPTNNYIDNSRSKFPLTVLISGIITITLLLTMLHIINRSMIKTRLLLNEVIKRERLENDLSKNEELLRVTLESMVDAVILIDNQGRICNFNASAVKTFGYSKEQVMGHNIRMLMPEPYHSEHDSYLHNFLSGGKPKAIGLAREVTGLRANGEQFPMTLSVVEIITDNQHYFSGVVRDITSQKRADEKITHYTQELLRSNKELDDFAYVASHDLKAPLRGITQLANWIEEDLASTLNAQTKEYLNLMHNRINRLNKLLDDLLSYSRVGRMEGGLSEINLNDFTKDIIQLLNPPQGFELKLTTNITSIVTLAVPFELVLRNLINNSIKHHDKDNGLISIEIEEENEGYQVTVIDDGPGIPPEHQDKVFQIFQTLKPRDEVEGSGMGLAIVKKVIDRYRGEIIIDSNGKRGTKFSFSWPNEKKFRGFIHG